MPWVYILRCHNGALYVGSTSNLERRIAEHQEASEAHTHPLGDQWLSSSPRKPGASKRPLVWNTR